MRVQRVFSEAQFVFIFPLRDRFYTYDGFLEAVGSYPLFCDDKGRHFTNKRLLSDDEVCKRELSMLFAHFNQETGANDPNSGVPLWRQGLAHTAEWNCKAPQTGIQRGVCDYKSGASSWATEAFPPQGRKHYYGRGPLQISWNYNYGYFSKVISDDVMYLL